MYPSRRQRYNSRAGCPHPADNFHKNHINTVGATIGRPNAFAFTNPPSDLTVCHLL